MSNGHIVSLYERWTRLEDAKAEATADLKEFFAETKGNGYTPKALKASFKIAATKNNSDVQEHNALVELYSAALEGGDE